MLWMDGFRGAANQTGPSEHRWRDGCQLLGQVSWWNQEVKRKGWWRGGGGAAAIIHPISESGRQKVQFAYVVGEKMPHRDLLDNTTCHFGKDNGSRCWNNLENKRKVSHLFSSYDNLQTHGKMWKGLCVSTLSKSCHLNRQYPLPHVYDQRPLHLFVSVKPHSKALESIHLSYSVALLGNFQHGTKALIHKKRSSL